MNARRKPEPSGGEWLVLNCLWRRGGASTRELLGDLRGSKRWAYSTLKTVLARMEAKGLVRSEPRGRETWYEAAVAQDSARASALSSLIDRVFDGAAGPLLAHLIDAERLSAADRKTLERWRAELDAREGKRAGG